MPLNAYTDGLLELRENERRQSQKVTQRLETAMRSVWAEVDALIKNATNDKDEIVYARWITQRDSLQGILNDLAIGIKRDINDTVSAVISDIAATREGLTNELLAEAGSSLRLDLGAVNREVLQILATRPDIEGLKGSSMVWAENQHSKIFGEVLLGRTRGESSRSISMRLREFVLGADAFTPSELADLRTVKGAARRKLGQSINAKAKRLARSETVNAAWEANRLSAQESPIVGGVKWNLSNRHPKWDVCDILATQDLYGLGKGVYPPETIPPKPHPNDFCFQTDVIRPQADWDKPKAVPTLRVDPEKIQVGGKGTKGFIETQNTLARELVRGSA